MAKSAPKPEPEETTPDVQAAAPEVEETAQQPVVPNMQDLHPDVQALLQQAAVPEVEEPAQQPVVPNMQDLHPDVQALLQQAAVPEVQEIDQQAAIPDVQATAQQEQQIRFSPDVPSVKQVQFAPIGPSGDTRHNNSLDLILNVEVQATVELGRANMQVRDVLELGPGSVVELEKLAGEPVDVLVNNRPFARGEVVVIDEYFGVRVTEIISPGERITSLA